VVLSGFRDRGRNKYFGQLHPQERALYRVPTDGQKGLPYPNNNGRVRVKKGGLTQTGSFHGLAGKTTNGKKGKRKRVLGKN